MAGWSAGRSLRGKLTFVLDKKCLWEGGRKGRRNDQAMQLPAGTDLWNSSPIILSNWSPFFKLSATTTDRHRDAHKTTVARALHCTRLSGGEFSPIRTHIA